MKDEQKWPALLRGSVINTAIGNHMQYIRNTDTRAQGLIFLNSALIPIAISGLQNPLLRPAAILCIITALITAVLCIAALYPKRLQSKAENVNILHYTEFTKLSQSDFLENMSEIFSDTEATFSASITNLYHIGKRVLAPRILFLRLAYGTFLAGQLIATLLALLYSV